MLRTNFRFFIHLFIFIHDNITHTVIQNITNLRCSSIRHDKRAGVYYREFIYKHSAPILKAFQNIIILGDFNMIPENPHFLRRHQLKQLVTSPTHTLGATLDFIITSVPVQQVTVKPSPFLGPSHCVCNI